MTKTPYISDAIKYFPGATIPEQETPKKPDYLGQWTDQRIAEYEQMIESRELQEEILTGGVIQAAGLIIGLAIMPVGAFPSLLAHAVLGTLGAVTRPPKMRGASLGVLVAALALSMSIQLPPIFKNWESVNRAETQLKMSRVIETPPETVEAPPIGSISFVLGVLGISLMAAAKAKG